MVLYSFVVAAVIAIAHCAPSIDSEGRVSGAPVIDKAAKYTKAAGQIGYTGRLVCHAAGAPTVSFKWHKNGVEIGEDFIKYEIEKKVTDHENYESILQIKNVVIEDYGIYQCIATNENGEDRFSINFDDKAIPDPPYGIELVNVTHDSITLRWHAGFDGGMPQGFRVLYKLVSNTDAFVENVQQPDSTVFTARGLAPDTEYELKVKAYNAIGESGSWSEVINAKTLSSNLCEPNEVQCSSGQCLMKSLRCDGKNDCKDGYDETNCPSLSAPGNFELVGESSAKSAVFQWDPINTEIKQGEFKGYKIRFWETGQRKTTETSVDLPRDQPSNSGFKETVTLNSLPPSSCLQAEVVADYTHSVSYSSNVINFCTPEEVNRPPKIIRQPTYRVIYYRQGETVEIPCEADGIPKSRYTWKRNGEDFSPSGQHRPVQLPNVGTLLLISPDNRDSGTYQCFADNGYGISASAKIVLKMGKIGNSTNEPRKKHKVEAGKYLTLPCIPPSSYPPAVLYWVLREHDGSLQPVNFDNRVSMDLEGRLRFTNVRKSDEQDGQAYSCLAMNPILRSYVTGPEHVVEVTGTAEQAYAVSEMWTSPADQVIVKGQELRLKCIFSGNPTPDVSWEKLNGTFPDRAQFESFGQELRIFDVQESDAGKYRCMGENPMSPQRISKSFDIRVESEPSWVDEPQDVEARINEQATFICRAASNPSPTYTWYINGVPLGDMQNKDPRIYSNNRFFQPDDNTITLTGLTLEDHMNIQCNASNKHGYVFADVYLNVFEPVVEDQGLHFIIRESPSMYTSLTLPFIENETHKLQWVYDILEKKTKPDKIMFEDPDPEIGFVLLPVSERNMTSKKDLNLVAIVQKHGIRSIRDLDSYTLPLLNNIQKKGQEFILETFGIPPSKLNIYVQYQPAFYHFHVYFKHQAREEPGFRADSAHLLTDVIDNIGLSWSLYRKRTLTFTVGPLDDLYRKYKESGYF